MYEPVHGNLLPSQARAIDAAIQGHVHATGHFSWELRPVDWEQTYRVPTVVHAETGYTFGIDYHDTWSDGYGTGGRAAFVIRYVPGIQSARDEVIVAAWDKVLERFGLWLTLIARELGTPEVFAPTSPDDSTRSSVGIVWTLLHPDIASVARNRFEGGHYADSVEAALKHINELLQRVYREATGQDKDGAKLMKRLFSVDAPILTFGDLTTETGKSMQIGYMELFSGAMTGIRNPKAHANVIIDQKRAIHFLFVASLLRYKVDEAQRVAQQRIGEG